MTTPTPANPTPTNESMNAEFMAGHPAPWTIHEYGRISDATGGDVPRCRECGFPDFPYAAEVAVKLVNSHAALVEALRDIVNQMEACNMVTREEEPLIDRAKAALRAAGVEP